MKFPLTLKFVAILLICALMLVFATFATCATSADATDEYVQSYESDTEMVSEDVEGEKDADGHLQAYILTGSVVCALVTVTFIYKKKDEARYL